MIRIALLTFLLTACASPTQFQTGDETLPHFGCILAREIYEDEPC